MDESMKKWPQTETVSQIGAFILTFVCHRVDAFATT